MAFVKHNFNGKQALQFSVFCAGALLFLTTSVKAIGLTKSSFGINEAKETKAEIVSTSAKTRCLTRQLSVRQVSSDVAVGHVMETYAFTNISSSTCTLYGYPGFDLFDANNRPLKGVDVIWSKNYTPKRVTLAPGSQASFMIRYANSTGYPGKVCPTSAKIEVTAPNTYNYFTLREHIKPCGNQVSVTPVQKG